jgi:hypothetical protein
MHTSLCTLHLCTLMHCLRTQHHHHACTLHRTQLSIFASNVLEDCMCTDVHAKSGASCTIWASFALLADTLQQQAACQGWLRWHGHRRAAGCMPTNTAEAPIPHNIAAVASSRVERMPHEGTNPVHMKALIRCPARLWCEEGSRERKDSSARQNCSAKRNQAPRTGVAAGAATSSHQTWQAGAPSDTSAGLTFEQTRLFKLESGWGAGLSGNLVRT